MPATATTGTRRRDQRSTSEPGRWEPALPPPRVILPEPLPEPRRTPSAREVDAGGAARDCGRVWGRPMSGRARVRAARERESVGEGKSVDLGGRRVIKKKQ